MKKYILITLFSISHLAFANRENKITFFSNSSKTSDEIDTVDDPMIQMDLLLEITLFHCSFWPQQLDFIIPKEI